MGYLRTIYREYDQITGAVIVEAIVFQEYDTNALTCAQAEAPFLNLSTEQAQAIRDVCATVAPITPANTMVGVRNCSGTTTGGGTTTTTSDDEPAINLDLSSETDVTLQA